MKKLGIMAVLSILPMVTFPVPGLAAQPPGPETVQPVTLPPEQEASLRLKILEDKVGFLETQVKDLMAERNQEEPLNISLLSQPEVLAWTKNMVEAIYTYNYQNYKSVLGSIRLSFTGPGYESYSKALEQSKNLEAVQEKKLVVSAKAIGEPKIRKEGSVNGIYTWEVELPVEVTYKSEKQVIHQKLKVVVEIVRVKYVRNSQGLGINRIAAEIASSEKPVKAEEKTTEKMTEKTPEKAPEKTKESNTETKTLEIKPAAAKPAAPKSAESKPKPGEPKS